MAAVVGTRALARQGVAVFMGVRIELLLLSALLLPAQALRAQPGPEKPAPEAAQQKERPATGGRDAGPIRLAIWRLKPLGMDAVTAERLEGLLRAEAAKIEGVTLQSSADTNRILDRQADLASCGGETACLCRIGKALGVQKLSTGVIGALGDDYTFDLKLIDIGSCREERRINEALSGREDLLIGAIRQALYKLVAPALYVGSMSVSVPVAGAEVKVDGKAAGRSPLAAPIGGLKPGVHLLRISKEGFSAFEEEVPVRFQQTTRVKVDLVKSVLTGLSYEKENPVAPIVTPPPAWAAAAPPARGMSGLRQGTWWTGGLAVAAAAAAGVLGWRVLVAERELEEAAHATRPYLSASHRALYERGQDMALAANILWGVAGLAAATSVTLLVIDLSGGPPEGGEPEAAAGQLEFSPACAPDAAGFVLRGRF